MQCCSTWAPGTGGRPGGRSPTCRGVLDNAKVYDGQFTVEIVPPRYDAPAETWDNETYQRDNPGDTLLTQMKALSRGVDGVWFPDVPEFNEGQDFGRQRLWQEPVEKQGARLSTPGSFLKDGRVVKIPLAASQAAPGR